MTNDLTLITDIETALQWALKTAASLAENVFVGAEGREKAAQAQAFIASVLERLENRELKTVKEKIVN